MSMRDKFKSILANNAFDELNLFKEAVLWDSMTLDERELLGILFVKQGEHQLHQGDTKVLESFDLAMKVAPTSPIVYFRQAMAYASQSQNIRCLIAASTALERAIQLDPLFVNAWQSWGNVLMRMGVFYEKVHYFYEADEKFQKSESILVENESECSPNFYWHWGVCWYHIGKQSGEAVDFFKALEKFRKATETQLECGEFYNDFGNVLVDLACLMKREELFVEAAECYEKATTLAPTKYEVWLNLGCTYQRLYDFVGSLDYFNKSDCAFERTAELFNDDPTVWLRWAELYLSRSKTCYDAECLSSSLEKFIKTNALEENNPLVLLRWGEAEMFAASNEENLELLHQAEKKIVFAFKSLKDQPEAWYIYGTCMCEYGRYFSDEGYYQQAIERYAQGLALDPSHSSLLHGMALAYFAIGEMKEDPRSIKQAASYCNQVVDLGGRLFPQFLSDWGVILMKLGEITNDKVMIEDAAVKFEQAISSRLESLEGEEIEPEWLYNYGCALDFLGDFHDDSMYYEKAIQILAHVLKIDPEYHIARYNLALSLSHLGELNSDMDCFLQSVEFFHQVVTLDPEDEAAWNDYGLALVNLAVLTYDPTTACEKSQKYFQQAEAKFMQAVALGSEHTFYNLACLHALIQHPAESLHYLERAEHCNMLPPVDDVLHDEWLDNLRNEPAYRLLISRLINKRDHNE